MIKAARCSRKRVQRCVVGRNTGSTKDPRVVVSTQYRSMDSDRVIFVDETGINLHDTKNYGWAQFGQPCIVDMPTQRGKSVSVCAAIMKTGLVLARAQAAAFMTDLVSALCARCIDLDDPSCPVHYLFVDNPLPSLCRGPRRDSSQVAVHVQRPVLSSPQRY